jgi:type IV secretory pathway VirB2 component (pilin)
MSTRFISNIALALVSAVVLVASQAFRSGVTGWLTFGVSLGVLALAGVAQLDPMRGTVQRGLDAGTGALAVWAAVASVVFAGTTLTRLSFAEALGFVGLALTGLVAHELTTERVVHAFEAIPAETPSARRSEELPTAA